MPLSDSDQKDYDTFECFLVDILCEPSVPSVGRRDTQFEVDLGAPCSCISENLIMSPAKVIWAADWF